MPKNFCKILQALNYQGDNFLPVNPARGEKWAGTKAISSSLSGNALFSETCNL